MAPLVSILIPTYNRSKDIQKAILSCMSQVYENFEIIITDNSSDTETEKVISVFNSNKIKYYKNNENIGPILNWKKAFELSNGEWLIILPDDDYFINPFYISDCVNIINKNQINLIVTDCILGYPDKKDIGKSNRNGLVESAIVLEKFWKGIHIPTIANFFSKKIVNDLKFFYSNDILYSDIELWLKILCKEQSVNFYNTPSVYYTFHDENIVKTMSIDSLIKNASLFCDVFDDKIIRDKFIKRYLLFVSGIYPSFVQKLAIKLKKTYNLNLFWYASIQLNLLKIKVINVLRMIIKR